MSSFRFTAQAHLDVEHIGNYICGLDPVAADHFLSEMDRVCEVLAKHVGLGRPRPEFGAEVRSFPIGNFLIFYAPAGEGINVIRVLYGGRDLPDVFGSS